MALLSPEQEYERAEDKPSFPNSDSGVAWMNIWCVDCVHEPDCPLLYAAMLGRTPLAWVERDPLALNRYTCMQYEEAGDETTPV